MIRLHSAAHAMAEAADETLHTPLTQARVSGAHAGKLSDLSSSFLTGGVLCLGSRCVNPSKIFLFTRAHSRA
jgi:hypothetical protein